MLAAVLKLRSAPFCRALSCLALVLVQAIEIFRTQFHQLFSFQPYVTTLTNTQSFVNMQSGLSAFGGSCYHAQTPFSFWSSISQR